MKNQWPFWLFIIAIVVVVVISMNYQGKDDVVPLGELFPDEQAFDYEYVNAQGQLQKDPAAVSTEGVPLTADDTFSAPAVVKNETASAVPPAVTSAPVSVPAAQVKAPVKPAAPAAAGSYTIQVLSSKDQAAMAKTLEKAKASGFPEAYIGTAVLGEKGTWFRLYIGSYSSMAQAQAGLPKVKEKYPQAFIVKLAQ